MIWLAIITPYLAGVAGYFLNGWPIWPWLIVACIGAAFWNPKAAAMLAVAVMVVQVAKNSQHIDASWVYYAVIYATIGFIGIGFIDRVGGGVAFVVALAFALRAADVPFIVVDSLTELAFIGGLIGAAYVGPSGGSVQRFLGAGNASASGAGFGLSGEHRRAVD